MATLRLRKPGGGSTLRGGDGLRAPDKRVFEFTASGGLAVGGASAVSKTKVFTGDGGIEFGGAAAVAKIKVFPASGGTLFGGAAVTSFVDGRGYVASGGIRFGGAAVIQFKSGQKPIDHGGFYVPARAGVPIPRRRQFIPRDLNGYRASGGMTYGGTAETGYMTGEQVRERNEEEAILLLLAAA